MSSEMLLSTNKTKWCHNSDTIVGIYTAVESPHLKSLSSIFKPGKQYLITFNCRICILTCIPEYWLLNSTFNSLGFHVLFELYTVNFGRGYSYFKCGGWEARQLYNRLEVDGRKSPLLYMRLINSRSLSSLFKIN
jgi:hypothetical protein